MCEKIECILKSIITSFLKKISDEFKLINNITIGVNFIYTILITNNDTDILYKNLVYLNRFSKIGMFSLSYQYNIVNYLNSNNDDNLILLLLNPISIEYDNNELLNSIEKIDINKLLTNEMICLNHYICLSFNLDKILDIDFNILKYNKCLVENNNVLQNKYIIIPFNNKVLKTYYLPNIIYYIIKDKNNKYPIELKNYIKNSYPTQYKFIQKYLSIF